MSKFEFIIIASGLDPEAEDFEDRFFEAGCDDATVSFQKGLIVLRFTREAPDLIAAMTAAVANVEAAGANVQRFEPDYVVTSSEISARSGLTRAAISLYANGSRASGFPQPIARVTSESPLWDWSEVAEWLYHHRKIGFDIVTEARLMKTACQVAEARSPTKGKTSKRLKEMKV